MSKFGEFYNRRYKLILIIPFFILVISLLIIVNFYNKNGDFFEKDVSLKGGVSATFYADKELTLDNVNSLLKGELGEVYVRSLASEEGNVRGFLIEASKINSDELKDILEKNLDIELNDENYFVQETGSRLGEDFYKQMIRAIIIAFILMGITIFIIFRSVVPSLAVILSAFLDIVGTIALINLIGIRVSSAGITSLLLLIGYSVDTDVVLTTRMVKRKEGNTWERIVNSAKTGLVMTLTSLAAVGVGYIFSNSLVLKQMFSIIFLGLIVDLVATYGMNAGLLKWYLDRKENG